MYITIIYIFLAELKNIISLFLAPYLKEIINSTVILIAHEIQKVTLRKTPLAYLYKIRWNL